MKLSEGSVGLQGAYKSRPAAEESLNLCFFYYINMCTYSVLCDVVHDSVDPRRRMNNVSKVGWFMCRPIVHGISYI